MSDSYERSYYEIALTNGQVLVALGILLGCVLGAFLSGMWVARQALDRAREGPRREQVASLASPDGEAFEFFGEPPGGDDRTARDADQAPAPTPSSSRPPAQVQQLRPLAGAAVSADRNPREPNARQESSPTAVPAVHEDGEAQLGSEAAAPAESSGPQAAAPAPLEDVPVIQVFSSNDQPQAAGLVERLRSAGYRAFLSPVKVDGRTMYRVRVGPFSNRQQAEVEAEKVKREFKLDTWITTG